MKCCASQTTSTAKHVPAAPQPSLDAARSAAVTFQALLLQEAFKPLTKALGFYGEAVTGACAQAIARADHSALTERLEHTFASEPEP